MFLQLGKVMHYVESFKEGSEKYLELTKNISLENKPLGILEDDGDEYIISFNGRIWVNFKKENEVEIIF